MFKKEDSDLELELLIKNQKDELNLSFKSNFYSQEKTLELFLKGIDHSEYNSFNETRVIWNIAGFINIVSYDLKVVGKDLIFADNEWQKRYYARQACLIMYESVNDLFELLGSDFKSLVSNKFKDFDFEARLKNSRQELNQFKKNNFAKLKEIRNVAIAHRDVNILKQIELIDRIKWIEIIGVVKSFDNILNDLGGVFQDLINDGIENLDELKG